MTLQEKIICTAYTGTAFCEQEDYGSFLEYADKLMGRPCQTFEMADPAYWNRLRELSKPDFHKVLNGEYSSDEHRTPKKVTHFKYIDGSVDDLCPTCCCVLIPHFTSFCSNCGQALDWSEVNDG